MKYRIFSLFMLFHLFVCSSVYASMHHVEHASASQDVWLIIHGTFARTAEWHYPWGDFFKALQHAVGPKASVHHFIWSGRNSYKAREKAADECRRWLRSFLKSGDRLHIIGHSHGGNVAIAMAQMLQAEKSPYFIETLITLGTPICTFAYVPPMARIKRLYAFFSYGDRVQPVGQMFKRVFNDHPRIYNIQLQCNTMCPTHTKLHAPLVAQWLPSLVSLIERNVEHDLIIQLFDSKNPNILFDSTRQSGLETDRQFTQQIFNCIADSRNYEQRI